MRTTWEKLENAFEQCHALSGAPRKAYLNEVAREDPDLFVELRKLLDADDLAAADSFFEPGSLHGAELLQDRFVGKAVGTFTLTELIGEGGMGAVYRAEQTRPFHRLAAIKIIRVYHTNDRLQRRFESEVQTLARLNHPNIASVYFSGVTDDGLPYFCMELVEGLPLDAYCRHNKLNVEQRLNLFIAICRAVHFAHQRGVIHRDLKPANILITEVDGEPQPKIIDFGIAKAVQADNQVEHSFQVTATQLTIPGMAVGTLGYMSPEQTLVNGDDVDLRTDVYSLGVILYEMLVGELPLQNKSSESQSWDQTFKAIRELQPVLPSRAVLMAGGSVSEEMGTGLPALGKIYRGDIDWITIKAMEKDPDRRYESALSFAEDCERHLINQPVVASPPSLSYQIGCFVKRNKLLSVSLIVVLAALIVAVVGLIAGAYQAKQAERRMLEEIDAAKATIEILKDFVISASPGRGGLDVKVIDRLEEFAPEIETMNISEAIRGKLYVFVGQAFCNAGEGEEATYYLDKARALNEIYYGKDSYEAFEAKYFLCRAISITEDGDSEVRYRKELFNETKVFARNARLLSRLGLQISDHYSVRRRFDLSRQYLLRVEEIKERFPEEVAVLEVELKEAWGIYYFYKIENKKALIFFQEAVKLSQYKHESQSVSLETFVNMASIYNDMGDYQRSDYYIDLAMRLAEEFYGGNHYQFVYYVYRKVHVLVERGAFLKSLSVITQVGSELQEIRNLNNDFWADVMNYGVEAARRSGNYDMFLPTVESYISKVYRSEDVSLKKAVQVGLFGDALLSNGELEPAKNLLLLSYGIHEGRGHTHLFGAAHLAYFLCSVSRQLGEMEEASRWGCIAISHFEQIPGTYNLKMADIKVEWVMALVQSDYPEGAKELDEVIEEAKVEYGETDQRTLDLIQFREDQQPWLQEKAQKARAAGIAVD
ncbi:serine/threonine protein kinase [Acanthopleuribacter pedis]|uniref:Serine/threonine protein kinase n=1 Tax=Acanthopleuribacter pedis TaxID=442870 RepID=A0A8J7QEE4_9BACT|nr:serine/threonine-protein kinase [Acanthopleuribacter pedis]MBO1321420.1 serine/threonine protein kinase [Acanthopleuribacter pedis]